MNYRIEWLSRIADVAAADWDGLLADDHPFVRHAFLLTLESSGSLRPALGWTPQHLTVWDGPRLVAAAPCYVKGNSHGEFVFDWHWAEAYQRAGGRYYPKLLCAVPYSPVTGPRLLAAADPRQHVHQQRLLQALAAHCDALGLSAAQVNFPSAGESAWLAEHAGPWLARSDWQFHWHNHAYPDFAAFLATLNAKKRKNIRHERQHLRAAGWSFESLPGSALDDRAQADIHRFYARTFIDKGNTPALTPVFFRQIATALPDAIRVVFAHYQGERRAMAWFMQGAGVLYGRYWGSDVDVPGLHFECCYYQGIEHCIAAGLQRFEPGAQGEHKLARGFLPVRTHSFHYLREPPFRRAVADWLAEEAEHLARYGELLARQSPFRR